MLVVTLPDLLLYFNICTNKNMSREFIKLSNLRNLFLCLITQANIVVKIDNNNLSGLD